MKKIDSAKFLMLFDISWFKMSAGLIFLPGMSGLLFLISISVFMSIMFPTICGIALRDMGDEAKIGSTDLVRVIVGGALIPVLQGSILDWPGYGFGDVLIFGFIREVNFSFLMPMICLTVVANHGYNSYKPKYSA
jgi:FHS family L-fucose permease-like MFS transporter